MKKIVIICIVILLPLSACSNKIPEPDQCSLCAGFPHHAPCIINLSTGEMLELTVYEPHPFIVGELAEEQRGGTFSFIHGAGAEGYKLSAELIVINIPMQTYKLEEKHFCNTCRERLAGVAGHGYVLADLKDLSNPVIYNVDAEVQVSFRCYNIIVREMREEEEYEIGVTGTLNSADQHN